MRKLIADEWMTLDGVIQAPGQPDEDPAAASSTAAGTSATSTTSSSGGWPTASSRRVASYFGRRTYEIFAAHWPNASEEERVLAEPLNSKPRPSPG